MRHSFLLIFLTLLTIFPSESQTRRALVIGLGEQKDASWAKINGDRDVPLITGMLRANGFTDITTLVNRQATKEAVMKGINTLISRAKNGDILYIHFSGHGQRITDIDGDETADRWDEAWIPYDAYQTYCLNDRGEKHISDDELNPLLAEATRRVGDKGAVVVTADACHSGDATRGLLDGAPAIRGVMRDFVIPGRRFQNENEKHTVTDWVTLSACKDYQLNIEHPSGVGSLSHALATLWPRLASLTDNAAVVRELKRLIRESASLVGLPQEPVISAPSGRLFTVIFTPAR